MVLIAHETIAGALVSICLLLLLALAIFAQKGAGAASGVHVYDHSVQARQLGLFLFVPCNVAA